MSLPVLAEQEPTAQPAPASTPAKPAIDTDSLPYAGLTTLELEQKFDKQGDFGAAFQLGKYWFLERDNGNNNEEANYLAKKWLHKAAGCGHPAIDLYLDVIDHPERWVEPVVELVDHAEGNGTSIEPPKKAPLPDDINDKLQACKELAESGDFDAIELLLNILPPPTHEEFARWITPLRAEAKKGDVLSAVQLAQLLINHSVANEKDLSEGVQWAQKAADQGNTDAMVLLGTVYCHNLLGGDPQANLAKGKQWWEKAEQAGHIGAISKLRLLMREDVSETDPETEKQLVAQDKKRLRQLCDRGQIDLLVSRGIELVTDDEDAPGGLSMLERAADLESFQALSALAQFYEDNNYNVPQDDEKSFRFAQALANKKSVEGYCLLAKYYEKGTNFSKQNPDKAMESIQEALRIAPNNPKVLVTYARFLLKGIGTEKNPEEAFAILKDLEQKDPDTPDLYFLLGYMYEEGKGTKCDLDAAMHYYKQGADKGDSRAMNNLGSMYELGRGTTRDIYEAIKWYKAASDLGDKDAKDNLKRARASAGATPLL